MRKGPTMSRSDLSVVTGVFGLTGKYAARRLLGQVGDLLSRGVGSSTKNILPESVTRVS